MTTPAQAGRTLFVSIPAPRYLSAASTSLAAR